MRTVDVRPDDPRTADYRNLTDVGWRQVHEPAEGLFLAEGEKIIRRALEAGWQPRGALMTPRWLPGLADLLKPFDIDVLIGDESTLREVVGFRLHRGALAAFARRPVPVPTAVLAGARRIVILEDLVDHTNVGVVFRTAAALGMDAVLVTPRCADPYYRRAVKTSMGAVLELPWAVVAPWPDSLRSLKAEGWTTAALTPDPTAPALADFAPAPGARIALLLGSEGPGLTPAALDLTDVHLRIPVTSRVDSLNVAAAAAIACYALASPVDIR